MQPAVLRLIHQVATAGRSAGKPVAVCGEMAGDVRLAPVLVGLGIDELGMTPTALPKVRGALAPWSSQELSDLAERILQLNTVPEVGRVRTEFQHSRKAAGIYRYRCPAPTIELRQLSTDRIVRSPPEP